MITVTEVLIILAIHWFADFLLQTDKQAKGKSKECRWLLAHTCNYSLVWLGFIFVFPIQPVLLFVLITFMAHTITDYFTSRLNSKLWAEGKVHYFFVSIGFDQLLHYTQLLITYQLLK